MEGEGREGGRGGGMEVGWEEWRKGANEGQGVAGASSPVQLLQGVDVESPQRVAAAWQRVPGEQLAQP